MNVLIELKDDRSEKIRYDNVDYPIYIRRGVLSHYPKYAAPNHWHDDVEFISILDGEMDYNVNGEIVKLKKGEGIFVNSRQMHFGFSSSKTECNFICVIFHPILLCAVPAFERDLVLPIIDSEPFVFLTPNILWQRDILKQIILIDQSKGNPLKSQSSFFLIWSLLYENLSSEAHKVNSENGELSIIKNMVGYIQKNYIHKISLEEIALSGAVGQSKCCKLFAKYFSQTPNNYLNKYRLDKSLELLCGSDMSVTEIALSVGFCGASYYAEVFRRCFGQTPTEYRKSKLLDVLDTV